MIEVLAMIEAGGEKPFIAGVVLWNDRVVEAAPIVGYMKRQKWSRAKVRDHCTERGWRVSIVWQMERHDVG